MGVEQTRSCIFAAAICLGAAMGFSPPAFSQTTQAPQQMSSPVAVGVQLLTDSNSYKVDDKAEIRILLTNKTRTPIYIRTPLNWGFNASVEIWAKDSASGRSQLKVLADSIDPPPRSQSDFVRLDPDHIYGVLFRVSLKDLGIEKPGSYEFSAIYHSHVSGAEFRFGLPSWNGEEYPLRTNPVIISVVP